MATVFSPTVFSQKISEFDPRCRRRSRNKRCNACGRCRVPPSSSWSSSSSSSFSRLLFAATVVTTAAAEACLSLRHFPPIRTEGRLRRRHRSSSSSGSGSGSGSGGSSSSSCCCGRSRGRSRSRRSRSRGRSRSRTAKAAAAAARYPASVCSCQYRIPGPTDCATGSNKWANVGALMNRIGFWCTLHNNCNTEPKGIILVIRFMPVCYCGVSEAELLATSPILTNTTSPTTRSCALALLIGLGSQVMQK